MTEKDLDMYHAIYKRIDSLFRAKRKKMCHVNHLLNSRDNKICRNINHERNIYSSIETINNKEMR